MIKAASTVLAEKTDSVLESQLEHLNTSFFFLPTISSIFYFFSLSFFTFLTLLSLYSSFLSLLTPFFLLIFFFLFALFYLLLPHFMIFFFPPSHFVQFFLNWSHGQIFSSPHSLHLIQMPSVIISIPNHLPKNSLFGWQTELKEKRWQMGLHRQVSVGRGVTEKG